MNARFLFVVLGLYGLIAVGCKQTKEIADGGHQHETVYVDWHRELAETRKKLEHNPNSSFLHNQAAVAYDALGDFENFDREIHIAIKLDPENPNNYYGAYAVHKTRHLRDKQISMLDDVLQIDPENPVGHYERGFIFADAKQWQRALSEYQVTKAVVTRVKSNPDNLQYGVWNYVDPCGNPFEVGWIASQIDAAIARTQKEIRKTE